jgi:Ca2+/Na+ antiporter
MSEEKSSSDSRFDFYKGLIIGGSLFLMLIFEWIEKHPYTTVWILAFVAFVVYLFFFLQKPTSSGSDNDIPKDYH